jgi:ABC-2 type transport system permease protein
LNKYYIAHNISPNQVTGWSFATTAQNLSTLLIAFILVVAGDIVASEFSTGTIKMLLTQTATRTKILASKYLAMLLYGLFLTAVMFGFSLVIGWVFFGSAGAGEPHVYADAHGHIQQMGTALYLLMQYGFLLIQIVITATIAFMISAIFRSSALAITISLLCFLVGNTLVQVLSSYTWDKYILFANTDLSQFVEKGPVVHGLTLGFSITMLVIYFVVMMALSWLVFRKRDVAYT